MCKIKYNSAMSVWEVYNKKSTVTMTFKNRVLSDVMIQWQERLLVSVPSITDPEQPVGETAPLPVHSTMERVLITVHDGNHFIQYPPFHHSL